MPHFQKHPFGSFSWIELATTDQNAAKQFYGALFQWEASDVPMQPTGSYTRFKLDGHIAAGCYTIPPGETMPPNWGVYVAVENSEETVARATALGGKVVCPVTDVFTLGRTAGIQDPSGAFFSIWQAKDRIGLGVAGENGTLVWADLNTPERERAKTFYEALFGWGFVTGKDKPADSYLHIKNGDSYIGGILPEPYRNKHAPPHWLIYFLVADCDASTERAKELGARVFVPPMSVDNSLRFSVLADPQGAVFALFKGSA
jgi:predicted enzyme related to lactoylglutathione lyase